MYSSSLLPLFAFVLFLFLFLFLFRSLFHHGLNRTC
jgi:hypothetical protein